MRSRGFAKTAADRRLLLVDDDVDARQALSLRLSADGFRVTECGNGREALEWLGKSLPPDIILLDLRMPVMNGWEFRVAQKHNPRFAPVPIVALSVDTTAQARAVDADAYVGKPIDYPLLVAAIERLLIQSDQRELQARLALTDRLTSLGTLAAGVAHEINNPLSYLLLNIDYLVRQLPHGVRDTNPELVLALEHVRHGADRIRGIVSGLRTFSQPDSDALGHVNVAAVLDATLDMVANELRHRARLVKDYARIPPVFASEAKLGQVFLNLLMNAVQALPDRSVDENEIRVVVRPVSPGRVAVEVEDNGIGIDAQVRGRIFEPFFTTKPVGTGTGLGLAICHGIVSGLGGTISVESARGRGSRFSVELPAAADASQRPAIAQTRGSDLAASRTTDRPRVLVVDDEQLLCHSIQRLLSSESEVVAVTSAREGLAQIASGSRFDVILCDVLMPEMDAPSLYEAIVKIDRPQAERMVFITGGAFTSRARDFLERVPNARITKPFSSDALVALLRAQMT